NFVGFKWNSGIQNFNLKYDFKYYLNNIIKLQFGLNSIYYKFNPGKIEPTTSFSGISPFKLIDKFAFENAIYLDSEYQLSDKLSTSFGLDRKSTRLNSSHVKISYAVFCLKKKKQSTS